MPGGVQLTAGGPLDEFGGLVAGSLVDAQVRPDTIMLIVDRQVCGALLPPGAAKLCVCRLASSATVHNMPHGHDSIAAADLHHLLAPARTSLGAMLRLRVNTLHVI
jgi:hypothetical protein